MPKQETFWKNEMGNNYTEENTEHRDSIYKRMYGINRTELNKEFIGNIPKDAKILEVGCNRGLQLDVLNEMNYTNLWGIEINKKASRIAQKKDSDWNIINGSAFDLPFKDNYFDVVFTSGFLIHIHPDNLKKAMKEIYRASKKYIWCIEYFSEKVESIEYRGRKNVLWKNDFLKLFLENFDCKLIKKKKLKYKNNNNIDMMFLLEKVKK